MKGGTELHAQSATGEGTSGELVALRGRAKSEGREKKKDLRCSGARNRQRRGRRGGEWVRRRERNDRSVTKRA